MTTTSEQVRAWRGPAILGYGFRPFFLFGAAWAALAMALWLPMLSGHVTLPTAFDPVSWHAHEFLFGYLGAVVAGFLLTAVPNWTGRLPIVGWRLGALFALWLAGRVGVAVSDELHWSLVAIADLSLPIVLAAALGREILAGKNWRNLTVLVMLGVFALANGIFHIEAAGGSHAAQGAGLRLGLGAGLMLVAVIGGRIVPSFTRNWIVKRGGEKLPSPPMRRFDKVALMALPAALLLWVAFPFHRITAAALLLAGVLHFARLARWRGHLTFAEPLVAVLHAAYSLLPLGALAVGIGILAPGFLDPASAQHIWMGGAIGLMTLAVMTRATLGHTGRALHAGPGTVAIYTAMALSAAARVAAGFWPMNVTSLYALSGLLWIGAFAGFVALYGPLLLQAVPGRRA
jgi:uncharacterized protein involved in response to NO